MIKRKLLIAGLAACLSVQMATAAFAQNVGPGGSGGTDIGDYGGPGGSGGTDAASDQPEETSDGTDSEAEAYADAWKKVDGVYMDDTGKPITGALLRGVSVSKWQGNVDWAKAAADDVSFALIRMGSFGYEGEYTMDEYFDANMRGAKANGVHTAPYVYLQTRTVDEAKAAAAYAVQVAGQYDITYPVAVDVESEYIMSLSVQELTDVVNAFCQVVAEAGYTPIIYSDYHKFTTKMDTSQFPYDIWLARYGGDNTYANRTMWQSTDKGVVNGISGYVCLEFAFKDYAGTLTAQTGSQDDKTPGEWRKENGNWYFYNNGGRMSGWVKPDGNWYYLDPANMGAMVSGTTMVIDGVSYTFNGSGVMQ